MFKCQILKTLYIKFTRECAGNAVVKKWDIHTARGQNGLLDGL